jgi:hypothetical protein
MKRLLAGLLALLIAALPLAGDSALLSSSKKLLASGSVTQANMKISAVDGTAFVDFSSAGALTSYLGAELHIRDSAGKEIVGVVKAAGSGETLGAEILTDGGMTDTANWPNFTNGTIASVAGGDVGNCMELTRTGGVTQFFWQEKAGGVTALALYKFSGAAKSGTSGNETYYIDFVKQDPQVSWGPRITGTSSGSWVSGTSYATAETANFGFRGLKSSSTAGTMLFDTFTLKQVTTPSATGVTITTTKGGTTYNWFFKDSSFNYNDSSGYTYKLYRTPPVVVASGTVTAANTRLDTTSGGGATAFAWLNGVDLSTYQTGKHILAVYDTSGRSRLGYMSSSAPAGETLGAEIHTSANAASDPNANEADATTGWTAGGLATFESTGAGTPNVGAKHFHGITNAFSQQAYYSVTAGAGKLFKTTLDAKEIAGHTDIRTWFRNAANDGWLKYESTFPADSAYHSYTYYVVADGATFLLKVGNGGADQVNEFYFDNLSIKQVTDPPSTGAKIVTTKGGATRGWYHADTGFDPNVGGTYKVIYTGD